MQIKLELLHKGDEVLNVWERNVAIKRKNGDVEIFHYDLGDDGLPRIFKNSILITQGDGVVRIISDDSAFEAGTF